MKKTLTIVIIGMVAFISIGVLHSFEVFNYDLSKNNLVGLNNEILNEVELHNAIIKDVNEISKYAANIVGIFKGLKLGDNLDALNQNAKDYGIHLNNLETYIITNYSGTEHQSELCKFFMTEYMPKIQEGKLIIEGAINDFNKNGITEEKLQSLMEGVQPKYAAFVETQNKLIEIINKNN